MATYASGEFELRTLACSTVYANKMDIEKQYTSWEAAWRKECGIACPVRKFCLVRIAPLEMDANSRPSTSVATKPAFVELAEADVLGATLDIASL